MSKPPETASEHPATWKFDYPIFHAESRRQWRGWLEHNHEGTRGVWLCSWRDKDLPVCRYPDAVEEAIAFGWIDSTKTNLDDDRVLQMFTPRRPRSTWTRLNRRRAADMEARGMMTDAGRASIEVAKSNGYWDLYDQVEDLIEPTELRRALDSVPAARQNWDAFPPTARKQMLWWVISAAKDATRSERIETIVGDARTGERSRG
ncbi:MAG: YdeI/OmpD-associated family protein [Microthrixaceae bacterium]